MTKRVRKNGVFKRYFDNGKQLSEESYNDGMLEGKWTYWYENGQVKLKGNFKPYEVLPNDERWERSSRYVFPARDSKHGKWTEWYENGQKELEQNYECGRFIGKWTSWYKNGNKKSVRNYKDGGGLPGSGNSILDGQCTGWHENGQKKSERHFNTNRMEGKWTEWDENGHTIREEYYKMGELINWKITKIPKFND
jgi:antitoxin component YwqK of YwqJK toxin-antitoxin module